MSSALKFQFFADVVWIVNQEYPLQKNPNLSWPPCRKENYESTLILFKDPPLAATGVASWQDALVPLLLKLVSKNSFPSRKRFTKEAKV